MLGFWTAAHGHFHLPGKPYAGSSLQLLTGEVIFHNGFKPTLFDRLRRPKAKKLVTEIHWVRGHSMSEHISWYSEVWDGYTCTWTNTFQMLFVFWTSATIIKYEINPTSFANSSCMVQWKPTGNVSTEVLEYTFKKNRCYSLPFAVTMRLI